MTNLIVELSKYLIVALMTGYAVLVLVHFRKKSIEGRNRVTAIQNFLMFFVHFLGFLILFLKQQDIQYLIFYFMQVVLLAAYLLGNRLLYPKMNRQILSNVCMLLVIDFIIQTRLDMDRAIKQYVLALVAAGISVFVPYVVLNMEGWRKGTWFYYGISVLLLLAVLVLGEYEYGAKLSLSFGSIGFQPAELVKILFVLFLAGAFEKRADFKQAVLVTAAAAVLVLILTASRDLGTALTLFLPYLLILVLATGQVWYLFAGLFCGGAAAYTAYRLFSHIANRVEAWLDPWADVTGTGWQMAQSLFALGTGGLFGMGLFQGMPYRIPVVAKDFVFSGIVEEMGLIVGVCLIVIYVGIVINFVETALLSKNRYDKLAAFGFPCILAVQVFLNLGGVIKMIPSTGLTLPFISYGGSSLLGTFVMVGIVQGIYLRRRKEVQEEYEERKREERAEAERKKAAKEKQKQL